MWPVIQKVTGKIGDRLTTYLHDIATANTALEGIIERMDLDAAIRVKDLDLSALSDSGQEAATAAVTP